MDEGHFVKANDFGLVNVRGQLFYLPGCSKDTADDPQSYQFQRRFVYAITNDITLNDYATRLIEVFGDNAKVGLCFLIASLFRDLVVNVTTSFPILNLFGPKGSGKSELAHSLTSFFIPSYIAPNINNTTKAALAEAVAEVSNAIVHIDEYKNTLDIEKREFLKGLWDGAGRSRMNMDNDKKRETTAVDCGVILSGQEMPTADIALFSRLVFLTFSKTTFSDDEKRRYNELKLIEKRGLTHLTGGLLKHRNQFRSNYRHMYDETAADFSVAFVGKSSRIAPSGTGCRSPRLSAASSICFTCPSHTPKYSQWLQECAKRRISRPTKTTNSPDSGKRSISLHHPEKYGSAWTTTSKRPRKREFRSKNQKRHWSCRKGHATYPYHSSVYRSYTPRKAEIPKAKRYPVTR